MNKTNEFEQFNLINYDWILIDLDDTIYPEKDFLFISYKNIASYLGTNHKCNPKDVFSFLSTEFTLNGRSKLFNKLIEKFNLPSGILNILLQIMRATIALPKIPLFPQAIQILTESIAANKKIIVITNGNPKQQSNKIKSLDWQGLDAHLIFIFANEFAPKPSTQVYKEYLKPVLMVDANNAIMFGDSVSDKVFAQNIGADFLKISWTQTELR